MIGELNKAMLKGQKSNDTGQSHTPPRLYTVRETKRAQSTKDVREHTVNREVPFVKRSAADANESEKGIYIAERR